MPFLFQHRPYRFPLRAPLRTAHGSWTDREGLLVRIEAADGRVGYGEVAPIPWFGTETLAEAAEVCAGMRGRIGPDVLAAIPEKFGCVRFAVACALESVTDTGALGVTRPSPAIGTPEVGRVIPNPPPSSRIPVAALLTAGKAALAELPAKLESGFLAFKWKVAVQRPEEELAIFDDLLSTLPSYAKLRIDANGGWDRRQATRWLERCAERPVELVEQPLAPADVAGLRGLAEDFPVTLALDESVVRLSDARRWQSTGWRGVFVLKPALCGPLREIESWAREAKADIVLSSAIETVVGRAAILRWALRSGVSKRALGFGIGEAFASYPANGPILGALLDATWGEHLDPPEIWDKLAANET